MRPHFQFPFWGEGEDRQQNPANAVEIDPRRTSAAKSMVIETASRLAPAYRAISLGGRDLVGGQYGGHRFKHAIASNQCMKQGGCDMQQDHGKKCKGEIEVRVPQKCMQAVALR